MWILVNEEWVEKMPRLQIKKSLRFNVFKRDSFTCQYCGQKAPDVKLEVDHIHPVSAGGNNDILNLVTSCKDCNAGKSDKKLSDSSAVEKSRKQLDQLQDIQRQQQLLYDWHRSLADLEKQSVDMAESIWKQSTREDGYVWTGAARKEIASVIKLRGFDAACKAIRTAGEAAMSSPRLEEEYNEVMNESIWKIRKIANVQNLSEAEQKLLYIRGICRNRFYYCNQWQCLLILKNAYSKGVTIETLEAISKIELSWSSWRIAVEDATEKQNERSKHDTRTEATDGTHAIT